MDKFVEVNEAVEITGKSLRTLYRLVASLKRKEGGYGTSVTQQKESGKTKTYISIEALREAYGIEYKQPKESATPEEHETGDAGIYKTLLQEKDRHINYLEKEIEVKNQQISSFQSQVENYQVIIQSKIPQLSEPTPTSNVHIEEEPEVQEGSKTSAKEGQIKQSNGMRRRVVLLLATVLVTGVIAISAYAYMKGYIAF